VTGAHTHNFHAIVEAFVKAQAIVQLPPMPVTEAPAELIRTFSELLANPAQREQIGTRARKLLEANRGATQRTAQFLEPLLVSSSVSDNALLQRAPTV
jgi:3-deoxy-D-manno-octulosonic-acid transferase